MDVRPLGSPRDSARDPSRQDPALPRVAVVGAGITGLGAALRLHRSGLARVTLFEKEATFGGHAHTVDITLPGADGQPVTHGVDTGFLVYNERTYPRLIRLFEELGTPTASSDMSFSVQAPTGLDGRSRRLEWNGADLDSVFAQRRNLVSPRFWWMLREILRFNRMATEMAESGRAEALQQPLGEFLREQRFGRAFQEGYLLPMIGCIWSCPLEQMLQFPLATLVRFCHNHGLLQVEGRPRWFTVRGGSRQYVQAVVRQLPDARAGTPVLGLQRHDDHTVIISRDGAERFDAVVMACHAPQALRLLGASATPAERQWLGPLRTQPNLAVLHTDGRLMPQARKAWAAWNFERGERPDASGGARAAGDPASVCLHYWLNRLQPLPFAQPVIVTLNPLREPAPDTVLGRFEWEHPVFDAQAIAAQQHLGDLQGAARTWFAGAWCGYGFHEDGLRAGMEAADHLIERLQSGGLSAPAARRAA